MSDRDIDTVLDACLALIEERGLSLEESLDRYPEHRSELEALLPVALRFRAARSLSAPATLQARIDAQLAAVRAADKPAALPLPLTFWTTFIFRVRNRTLGRRASLIPTLVTLILVAVVSMAGLVAGADAAGPGDLLFGLDIAIENARLSITSEDEEEAKLRLRFATERLDELKIEIEGEGNPEDIQAALAKLEEALAAIEPLLDGLTPEQRAELEAAIAILWASSQELAEFEFELDVEDGVGELEIEFGDGDDLDDDDQDNGDLDDDDDDEDECDSSGTGSGDCLDDDDDDGDECDSSGTGSGDCPDDDDDDEDECDSSGPGNGDCPDDDDDDEEECDSSGPGSGDDCDDDDDEDDDEDDEDDDEDDDEEDDD